MNTKDCIIYNSLDLFSNKGYDAVSIRDIAKSVGIKGSSIYNHFDSKESLYNSVLDTFSNHVSKEFDTISNKYLQNDFSNCSSTDLDYFIESQLITFNFLLTDLYSIKLKKMLLLEKYKNKKASHLFEKLYIQNILNYSREIIRNLLANSSRIGDISFFALELCSPYFVFFLKNDNLSKSDYKKLEQHLKLFTNYYIMGD